MKPISMFDPNSVRVDRGGSWYSSMLFARVALRNGWATGTCLGNVGFRLAWTPQ